MILIDKPYVSDFLIKTIKENQFELIDTLVARELISDDSLNWISETEAKKRFDKNPNMRIYTNSENSIAWIEKNFNTSGLIDKIQIFKNKIEFRELLRDLYPNYFFKGVDFKELRNLNPQDLKFPLIVKPAVGFFSIAVHKVDHAEEWIEVLNKIDSDIEKFRGLYPKEVLDITDFILEEYIEGKEYAVDCYFTEQGEPVILNILYHIFSSEKDVSDRIYTTSKEILLEYKNEIEDFLRKIGLKAKLKNFPLHMEVRIDRKRNIHPIEINPLRFGGWCTTGDISWYAFGINSYNYFLNSKTPDWNEIFKTREGKKYSIVVLDNNSGISENEIEFFDYDRLLTDFEKPLDLRKVNFREHPVFGFLFTETSSGNEKEILQILNSDLRKYIKTRK